MIKFPNKFKKSYFRSIFDFFLHFGGKDVIFNKYGSVTQTTPHGPLTPC